MTFAIIVQSAPWSSQGASSALRFARAVLAAGHQLHSVYFFGDGVLNASTFPVAAQDEPHLPHDWRELVESHGVDAWFCSASAARRGVLDADEASRHDRPVASAGEWARVSGLGQLAEAIAAADRVVNFG